MDYRQYKERYKNLLDFEPYDRNSAYIKGIYLNTYTLCDLLEYLISRKMKNDSNRNRK